MSLAAQNNTIEDDVLADFQSQHMGFLNCLFDAYLITDIDGHVQRFNKQLFQLISAEDKKNLVRKKMVHFDDLFAMKAGKETLNMKYFLEKEKEGRLSEITGKNSEDKSFNFWVSYLPIYSGEALQGCLIILRDLTIESELHFKYEDKSKQASRDGLTGLYNRRFLEETITNDIYLRELDSVGVIMIDIDHFKDINDNEGHQAGDFILQEVANDINKGFRKDDLKFRYGGEEFLVISPRMPLDIAYQSADKVRQMIEQRDFEFEGRRLKVTISVGVSIKTLHDEWQKAISVADQALYHSKSSGRNRVSLPDDLPTEGKSQVNKLA
jgi:diguanylate cyclase (GGDEF)-like protein